MNMEQIIAALEAAPERSRELDKAIYVALGLPITNHTRLSQRQIDVHLESVAPHYSTSLDAAVSLIPEREGSNRAGFLQAAMFQTCIGDISDERLALVVCVAALKAMEATP